LKKKIYRLAFQAKTDFSDKIPDIFWGF